ncbi:Crp/Fnr family transcriptional regulator [Sediminibacillus massiliensis]|uniref:Crp/Fnr family transcriptional regulator n=1 Tax=Sediminibacillus massiliensis TaxID=1926277 RepID=UPI0009888228|nr:cyclic nucleotide-binding domain-containing protein [Sediminibacillus massiliensis]
MTILTLEQNTTSLSKYGQDGQKRKGEILYASNRPENAVFYLKEGLVRLVNSDNCMVKIISPGEFFGDRSIYYSEKIYAEALSTIKFTRIDENNFDLLRKNNAKLTTEIMTSLSRHSMYLQRKQSLLTLAKESYLQIKKGNSLKLLFNGKRNKDSACMCCS